ncbi:right-handed parallel beta-helix repeat-containing protein [Nitrosomonas sp.]|uniref:right-handed parallel beta-helix repeat-containing protein n=1 Tax=Nitrosomonas sp. TaxID=42353 RepID=UPI001D9A79CE|nr:right-handed parallel beta-helix repeat-containing protein [Nitrosomonas sp.]MBX3617709.1 right-handed parallel beta-helix repeat-containing protein [Nitrosomonas sp.]
MDRRTFLLQGGAIVSSAATTLAFPNIVRAGLDWLNSTRNGIDIYRDYVREPTIFFDPSSTATKSLGTFEFPYKTQSEIESVVRGNMAGEVLGFKRGTKLRVTGDLGLNLSVHGVATNPFLICPYGDAEELPVITSASVVNWTLYDPDKNIWSYFTGSKEQVIWRDGNRTPKMKFRSNARDSLSLPNRYTFDAGTLYLRLDSGESANDGHTEITSSNFSFFLSLDHTVTDTGNLTVCGLNIRNARHSTFLCTARSPGVITNIDNIHVVGCQFSGGGIDNTVDNFGYNGLVIYGVSDAIRIRELYIAGCYSEDNLNNAYELAGTSGALVEKNLSYNCAGHSVIELWKSNDNCTVRYNWGDFSGVNGTLNHKAGGGIWLNNFDFNDKRDPTNTLNTNCTFVFNLITRCKWYGIHLSGGSGHVVQHNTFYADIDATAPDATDAFNQPIGWRTSGTAVAGFADISNNLFYWKAPKITKRRITMLALMNGELGNENSIPTGNKNIYYYEAEGSRESNFMYNKMGQANFLIYKSEMAPYALDQNSICSSRIIGGTLTESTLGFIVPTKLPGGGNHRYEPANAFTPSAAATMGLKTLTSIGTTYYDGNVYANSSATIGAFRGRYQ